MEKHAIESIMTTTMESIRDMVDVNTVIGEPVTAGDGTTIIPISRVSFGFVAGGGEYELNGKKPGPRRRAETGTARADRRGQSGQGAQQQECLPFAGGAGAGVSVSPVGFLVVSERAGAAPARAALRPARPHHRTGPADGPGRQALDGQKGPPRPRGSRVTAFRPVGLSGERRGCDRRAPLPDPRQRDRIPLDSRTRDTLWDKKSARIASLPMGARARRQTGQRANSPISGNRRAETRSRPHSMADSGRQRRDGVRRTAEGCRDPPALFSSLAGGPVARRRRFRRRLPIPSARML